VLAKARAKTVEWLIALSGTVVPTPPFPMSIYAQEARRTLALAGPIMIGQVSQMLMGVTDALMIGHVGKVPLAASAFAGSLFGFVFMIAVGLLIPVSIMVSRAHGGGDEVEAGHWLKHGMILAAVSSVLGVALMLWLGTQLHRFGQPPEVLAVVHPYYALIVISTIPALLFQVLRQFSESLERPRAPMVMMLIGVVLNIFLNWVLIYGNIGAPAMGLAGAGWATLISRILGMVVIWYWVSRSAYFSRAWPTSWTVGYQWSRFRRLLGLGIPVAFTLSFEAGIFGGAALVMGWLGSTALAAHQIAISCAAFVFMFPLGMAMAVSMRMSRAVGAGRLEALRPIGFGAQAMSAVLMLLFTVVFVVAGRPISAAFVIDLEVIELSVKLLVVAAIFLLADGAQVISANALRGLTDVKVPTLITAVCYWGLAMPLAYGLAMHTGWGPIGVWIGLATGLILAAVALNSRFIYLTRDGGAHVKLELEEETSSAV